MAYRKTWDVCVPLLPGHDEDVLLWLMRESAETKARQHLLSVVEFEDLGDVPPEDINPIGVKQLGPGFAGCTFRARRKSTHRARSASLSNWNVMGSYVYILFPPRKNWGP